MESLLAHDAGEIAPRTCRYCIVAEDSPQSVGIEPGPILALDADTAEDLHLEAARAGNGVGWLLFPRFNCSALGLIRFAFLNSLAVAFPVRTLTRSIVPQYLAASDPAAVQSMLPLGLEQMTYSFLDLVSSLPCQFWF